MADAQFRELVAFRLPTQDLALLRAAAHRAGLNVSAFIREATREAAERVLREREK